jgi:hypothetical protein
MKTLNIPLDDKQFKKLYVAKRDYETDTEKRCSWNRFLMILLKSFEGEDVEAKNGK